MSRKKCVDPEIPGNQYVQQLKMSTAVVEKRSPQPIPVTHSHYKYVGKYQLIYFDIRGRAEPVRLLLTDNGIEFEDIVCDEDSWFKQWKPQMPFGQLPCLKDNNLQLVQSNAILRHLGRKHALYGSNIEEAAQIDMINDGVEDLRIKYSNFIYGNYESEKEKYIAALPSQLQPFEKSFADYSLTDVLDIHLVLAPKCLDNFPTLTAYYKQNISRPGVAAYRKTSTFKGRTINYNKKQ